MLREEKSQDKSDPICYELALSLIPALLLSLIIPWQLVFEETVISGGDNPAHPVLIKELYRSFWQNFSLISYSYDFWGGFELFQFYFPLPYLIAALITPFLGLSIAYKLFVLTPFLLLPSAWYFMARGFGCSKIVALVASFLAISFLFCNAHVMWGANVFSLLAGMIANSYGILFFSMSLALFADLSGENSQKKAYLKTVLFALLITATCLSHFYTIFYLAIFCFATVVFSIFSKKAIFNKFHYRAFLTAGLLVSFWLLPLFYYQSYSSQFGGNWKINLFSTFSLAEKILFSLTLLFNLYFIYLKKLPNHLKIVLLSGLILLILISLSNHLSTTVFINIRLWPGLYFFLYLLLILTLDCFIKQLKSSKIANIKMLKIKPLFNLLLIIPLFFLTPDKEVYKRFKNWITWNFEGLNYRPGHKTFIELLNKLSQLPIGRISFESDDQNNINFGSVRFFESLPLYTKHQIIEGGILNSASFPGSAYTLQCLSSKSCAGWPAGSLMPASDVWRASKMMRVLGISYHIATSQEMVSEFKETGLFEVIFQDSFLTLFKLKQSSPLVEVYENPPFSILSAWPEPYILNLPRWDMLLNALYVVEKEANKLPSQPINNLELFNLLSREWNTAYRIRADLGYEKINLSNRLNNHIVHRSNKEHDSTFFIADRPFNPDLLLSNVSQKDHWLEAPLYLASFPRRQTSQIELFGRGYIAKIDEKEVALVGDKTIKLSLNFDSNFKKIKFTQDKNYKKNDKTIDLASSDLLLFSKFDLAEDENFFKLLENQLITSRCKAKLITDKNLLTLTTKCPGKPHLIKLSYYPKWQADNLKIYRSNHGQMVVIPKNKVTHIRHLPQFIDKIALLLTAIGVLVAGYILCCAKRFDLSC